MSLHADPNPIDLGRFFNTGKVRIGCAYVPRIQRDTARAISGPHKLHRRGHIAFWASVGACITFVLLYLGGWL